MQVLKFGGTSVGDARAIALVVNIVRAEAARDPNTVVVTSAMRGVTDPVIPLGVTEVPFLQALERLGAGRLGDE